MSTFTVSFPETLHKSALELGGSRPLPELFSVAGCKFDFSREAVAPLVRFVRDELAALDHLRST